MMTLKEKSGNGAYTKRDCRPVGITRISPAPIFAMLKALSAIETDVCSILRAARNRSLGKAVYVVSVYIPVGLLSIHYIAQRQTLAPPIETL